MLVPLGDGLFQTVPQGRHIDYFCYASIFLL